MTKYDPVDNILGISNVITPKAPKKPKGFGGFGRTDGMGGLDAGKEKKEKPLGGAFSHTYAYDELNRLTRAEGKAKGLGYAMDMSFGLMGEPLTKVQRTDSGSVAGSYALAYEYGDADHPTAPSQIGHERYTYDANGNPTLVEDDSLNTERRMAWDEENRLMALSDNGKTSRYTYNAAGERIVKSHGYLEGVYVNGAPQGLTFHETEDYTIYPAPILSVTRQRFTKHYFIGDRRIASKIGAGIFQNAYGHGANVVTAGQKDYQMRMMQIEKQREDYYRKLGTPPGVPTMKGATAEPENTHEGYNSIIKELGDHSVPDGWIQRSKRNAVPDTPPGPPVQWDKAEDPDDVQPGYGYVPADTAHHEDIFFYHTDHLGSTSYITDAKANVAQFDAYLPYGELLVDEHSSTEEMPYKFNGKELDEETGLYYYGARYMNPRTSLWYGVDPLAEKYPSIGGYVYCAGNPIIRIELNGNDWILATGQRVYWYGGSYGDKRELKHTYKSTSGAKNVSVRVNGVNKIMNLQNSKYQYIKGAGPTVEGKYKLNLKPEPETATIKNGEIENGQGKGIQILTNMKDPNNPAVNYTSPAWGEHRINLIPVDVKQPKENASTPSRTDDRDLNSFYIHDSEKGETHGCHEIEKRFFDDLMKYQKEGNESIYVKVKYPSKNYPTNGGTEKKK